MAKVTNKMRKDALATMIAALLAANEISEAAAEQLGTIFASPNAQPKTDADGNVWCNYFGVYLPAEEFNTNSKGKVDSMSKAGKKLHRAQRSAVNRANNDVISQFRAGEVSAEEMADLLNVIEKNAEHKYPQGTDDIPEDYPLEV